jgi:hypothetical protein
MPSEPFDTTYMPRLHGLSTSNSTSPATTSGQSSVSRLLPPRLGLCPRNPPFHAPLHSWLSVPGLSLILMRLGNTWKNARSLRQEMNLVWLRNRRRRRTSSSAVSPGRRPPAPSDCASALKFRAPPPAEAEGCGCCCELCKSCGCEPER